jgi:DNA repair protein RecN (Recombination protein N)
MNKISEKLIKYINSKKSDEFTSNNLISFLDKIIQTNEKDFKSLIHNYDIKYKKYIEYKKEFDEIIEAEKKVEDLKEFTKFEIEKIKSIDPKVDEYEELSAIKSKLSRKDKIEESLNKANMIFQYQSSVNHLLELMDTDSSFFDDAMNELNNVIEKYSDSLDELNDVDIEYVLDRIEKLVGLTKRFGSIEEALEYKKEKEIELDKYENISFEKSKLEKKLNNLLCELNELSKEISEFRKKYTETLSNKVNYFLKYLYLDDVEFNLIEKQLSFNGIDDINIKLKNANLENISSGEFNRLKLALISAMSEYEIIDNGILFLDEIDANLSGKESESIAKLLEILGQSYQVFAISHQPQLTAIANQHYLVEKNDGVSTIKLLETKQRVEEIARMISGKNITQDAINFATNILNIKN